MSETDSENGRHPQMIFGPGDWIKFLSEESYYFHLHSVEGAPDPDALYLNGIAVINKQPQWLTLEVRSINDMLANMERIYDGETLNTLAEQCAPLLG